MIENPSLVQASGFGFAPKVMPQVVDKREVPNYLGAFSAFTEKIVKPLQEDAFLEGVTDNIAGQIEERSWLTQESYMQGVAYSNFGGKLNEASGKFTELARTSLGKGESVQQYNMRAQEVLSGLNTELDNMGLQGKARELAQKQILSTHAASLETYQKEAETATKLRIQQGAIQQTQGTVSDISKSLKVSPTNSNTVYGLLSANYATLYETQKYVNPDPTGYASARTVDAVSGLLSQLNAGNPEDRQRFNSIQAATDKMMMQLSPEDYSKLQGQYKTWMDSAKKAQAVERETLFAATTAAVKLGQRQFTAEDYNEHIKSTQAAVAAGVISIEAGDADNARALALYLESAKQDTTSTYSTAPYRIRRAMNISNEAAANDLEQTIGKATGADPVAMGKQLIDIGIQSVNPVAVDRGYAVMYNQFSRLMGVDPEKIAEQATEADNRAWQGYVQQLRKAPSQAAAAAANIQDPSLRSAVLSYITMNADEVGYDLTKDMREIQRRKHIFDTQGKDGNLNLPTDAMFTDASFDRGVIWDNALAPSSFSSTPSRPGNFNPFKSNVQSPVQMRQLSEMNNLLREMAPYIYSKGSVPRSDTESAMLLQKHGYMLMFDNGPIKWNPELNKQLSVGVDSRGRRIAPQPEDVLRAIRSQQYTWAKKQDVPPEDVFITTVGNQLHFSAYDAESGAMIGMRNITVGALNDEMMAQRHAANLEAAKVRNKTTVGSIQTNGGKFVVTDGWSALPFGKELAANLARFEGFTSDWKNTRSAKDQKNPKLTQTEVIGIGVSKIHKKWVPLFDAAKGDPKKMGEVTAKFAQSFYRGIDQKAQVYGLDLYNPRTKQTALAFMDAHWHGNQKQYGAALKQPDLKSALEVLKQQPIFKEAQEERRKFYVQGLWQFYQGKQMLG